ncbi:MAG: protein kinase [Phycisphaerae bacterium]|nr:protein kinase [Phycisphaerae bacterium]NIX26072.1 protein kinase [Phycisphaerae bacterium]
MIGKTISHYKILEKLGSGGMGDVYKAEDTKLQRTVALKFLPLELTRDEESQQRFVQEARAASALDHPNIGTIHEIDEVDGQSFIAMAYYEGQTLKHKIEQGPLPIDEAIAIAIEIAQGLAKAHSKDIVHRDIKPANVLLTEEGQVKIIDFGLAKLMGSTILTKTGMTMGTVAYMSPEQTQGTKVDHRTDIWALGVILYEMLTGEHPFKGEYEQAVMYSIIHEDPEFITKLRSDIPMAMEKIVEKALAKNPDERFQTMDDMLTELGIVSEDLQSGASKKRRPIVRLSRKQRAYLYRAVAVLAVLIIAVGIYLWRSTIAGAAPVSVAIMPLQSLAEEDEQEWFTDGMTDALITDLAKIGGLRVIARASVMQYKGKDTPAPEIATALGVDYLVEGSVARVGEQVKVTTRLVNATKNEYLWAEDYEREFRNILALQGEIAETIARQIHVKLTPAEETRLASARPVNREAHELYLEGRYHYLQFSKDGMIKAIDYFNQALIKDPSLASAYAGLADVYLLRGMGHGMADLTRDEAYERAKAAANKALELDDLSAEAHKSLASVNLFYEWDWETCEKEFQRALELNPSSASTRDLYGFYLRIVGKNEEAVEQRELAQELDPLTPMITVDLGVAYQWVGQYDKAIEQCKKALEMQPNFRSATTMLARAYLWQGRFEEAVAVFKKRLSISRDSWAMAYLGYTYAVMGERENAQSLIKVAEESTAMTASYSVQLAIVYAGLGQTNRALDCLEKGYEVRNPWLPLHMRNPWFDSLHEEPRFNDLLSKIDLKSLSTQN